MYENITALTSFSHHYDTLPPSPVRSSVEPSSQPPFYISLDSSPASPSFQRRFPMAFVAMLGFIELSAGLLVLTLELLVFDVSVGVWCGGIYALAGAAALVLVIGTDRERHQISALLIFQLLALALTIVELLLHCDLFRKRCRTRPNEPTREPTFHCQTLLVQLAAAALVLVCTLVFSLIYLRVTLLVLKQPHGTFNMSNALHLTRC